MKGTIQHIFIIGKVWPEPNSSAAGTRMLQLIRLFIEKGWRVTFATAAAESEYAADLETMGVKTASIKLNSSQFDSYIKKLNPDIVLFDRFMTEEQYGWRVAEQCPEALRILDTEDLHCLRRARQCAWNAGIVFHPQMVLEEESAKREIASIYRCDASIIISEAEIDFLKNLFKVPDELLYYLPYLYDPLSKDQIQTLPGFVVRNGFVSIGNFLHEPNVNAVLWLKEEIWPAIRERLQGAELHIYGAYPSQKVFELHNPESGFLIKGRANDVNHILKSARVLLAPLRFGAGLKGKLVDAMMNGTPSVTTAIGAEGMTIHNEWCGMIRDDAVTFAEDAVKLHQNRSLWEKCSNTGYRIMSQKFEKQIFSSGFIDHLYKLKSELPKHRRENFTGTMLMHHTAASTKYMAKWIEVKKQT